MIYETLQTFTIFTIFNNIVNHAVTLLRHFFRMSPRIITGSSCLYNLWFLYVAMFGDFSDDDFPVPGYLKSTKLLPNQSDHLETKIAEQHREHLYVTLTYITVSFVLERRFSVEFF